ncbi:MAG: DUF3429 domain-containing protein, partial [Wenzhouxiangellaceae bacterium]
AWTGAPDWLETLLLGYAVVILAFMNGSLWAGAMERPADTPAPLVVSNALVLAGLVALILPLFWATSWLAVLFALHLVAEWRWVHAGHPGWYRQMRLMLSISVVGLLLIAALAGAGAGRV